MRTTVLYQDAPQIAEKLDQLKLTETALREAVRQGLMHRARLTKNHPRIYPGLVMWGEIVAALGDQLRPLEWERQDVGSFAITVNEEVGISISVLSGDEATGNPYAHPSNRSKKGRNTVEAIEANRQIDMFEDLLEDAKAEAADKNETWVLMHHTDWPKREIRVELSRPFDIGEDGKISEWSERIFLGAIPFDDDIGEIFQPDGPDIDFDIRRKSL